MKRRSLYTSIILSLLIPSLSGAWGKETLKFQTQTESSIPATIKSSSSAGDVSFPHKFHYEELEIECSQCHHETNASPLRMPHESYFNDFWINCRICHRSDASPNPMPQPCTTCHHASPTGIADETLSTKVVVHKKCWECHEIGKGGEASQSCLKCHIKSEGQSLKSDVSSGFRSTGELK